MILESNGAFLSCVNLKFFFNINLISAYGQSKIREKYHRRKDHSSQSSSDDSGPTTISIGSTRKKNSPSQIILLGSSRGKELQRQLESP